MPKAERRERKIILAALFTALTVVLGYLLAEVPNVELMTLCAFLSGVFLGASLGAVVGAVSILFYSLLSPYGPPLPPLLAAQVSGFLVIGASGGLLGPVLTGGGRAAVVASAAAGFVLTVIYDLLTTAATAIVALGAEDFSGGFVGVFLAGSLFVAIHVLSNTAIFAAAVVPVLRCTSAWNEGRAA